MTDFEAKEQQSKASIGEEDISTLLQRYSATTVLTLLQEVANFAGAKINWEGLVKKTSTGISNAREYQMLWRHLAYRHALLDKLEDNAEPLDDDSDLEFELEATPAVNHESSAEAAACVKVLVASGLPSDSAGPNNLTPEAPLSINAPNAQPIKGRAESAQTPSGLHGTDITVPVSVQKQPLPSVNSSGLLDGTLPQKKKRKPWSKAEDLELIAAVEKCGEGNWANILKGDFKGDRTASQLSQRWAIIRKKHKNLNVGGGTLTGTKLSEAQLAARHAMSLALDRPGKNLTSGIGNKQGQAQNQSQPALMPPKPSPVVESNTMVKSVVSIKRSPSKPDTDPDSMGIKAAAVAAGARIATPSDAASLMIAAQAKKAVHIIPSGGGSVIKRTISSGSAISGAFPNVHHIRTGLSSPALSSQGAATSGVIRRVSVKPTTDAVQSSPATATQQGDANPVESTKPPSDQEAKSKEEIKVPEPGNVPIEQSLEGGPRVSDNVTSPEVEQCTALQTHAKPREQVNIEEAKEGENLDCVKTIVCSDTMVGGTQPAAEEIPKKASVGGKLMEDSPGLAVDKDGTEVQVLS